MADAEARLAAALPPYGDSYRLFLASGMVERDPTIAADLNDAPRLRSALREAAMALYSARDSDVTDEWVRARADDARAALTEGSGE